MAANPIGWGRDDSLVRLLTCVDGPELLAASAAAALPEDPPRMGVLYRSHADGRLTQFAALGLTEWSRSEYATVSATSDLPVAQAMRERVPIFSPAVELPHAVLESGTQLLDVASEYVALPLVADGDCVGVLLLLLPSRISAGVKDHARLRAVATVCAHRLHRLLAVGGGETERAGERDRTPDADADDDGAPEAARSVALVTDRGRVSMLDLAMGNAGIGSFDWDFATGRLVWDERLCALFGIAPENFDGRIETFYAALHPEDRPMVEEAARESLETGRYHAVYRVVHPDGSLHWIDAESRVVYLRGGEPKGMIGVAMDRTDEIERESSRQSRSDFVLKLTGGLTAAVTTDDVVSTLIEQALPALGARWLTVYLRQVQGPMRLIGSKGFDERDLQQMEGAARRAHGDPLFDTVRAGTPMFLESRRQWAERIPGPDLVPPTDQHAWALLPMTSAEGLVGICSLIYDHARTFTPDDRTVLTAAAGILGQSIARARLHDTRRRYLTELQRLMLPVRLPTTPGLDVAACYRPGSEGLEVGGDWYDAVPLRGGRVALIIGDVQGHNVQAAGVMGQLRTSMRAYAADGHGPADLLARGDLALSELDTELFATCCIAEIDPRSGHLRIARAGHPYPLLLDEKGRVRELTAPGGMPLGTFPEYTYPETEADLPPGGALLLYTDGLVEHPGSDYTDGVAELCERFAWWGSGADRPPGRDRAPADLAGGHCQTGGPDASTDFEYAVHRIA
jgi:PAS domain-containing protein